jgi:hypothetical protein
MKSFLSSLLLGLLAACASTPADSPLPHYLCEQNLQFTARFIDNSVTLNFNQGFEVLFVKLGGNPNDYGNPRVSAEFNLGPGGKEAVVRYPVLPLALRCVKTN